MPRKKIYPELSKEDRFDDEIVEAIWHSTIEIRETIARRFEAGLNSGLLLQNIPGVTRTALLIASLVDAESPLVIDGRYRLRSKRLLGLVKVISVLPQFKEAGISPQISHRTVEKTPKYVENLELSVEKIVQKSPVIVDKLSKVYDLSSGCG